MLVKERQIESGERIGRHSRNLLTIAIEQENLRNMSVAGCIEGIIAAVES